jgi:CO/xanthine dehydrogenase Mo-binding subunit
MQLQRGDLAQGFAEAEVIVEREFTTAPVHQGYIETHASTGLWSSDGRITIWTSSQYPFGVRAQTAAILGVPESTVKIVPMEIGGGFGGKTITYLDPVVAMLSRKSGQPVKIVLTRKEVFEGTGPTSGAFVRCKIGATRDGRITSAELYLAYEAGAFPGSPVGGGVTSGLALYKIDNFVVDGYDVVVNLQKTAAYRAPGQPQANFAVEQVINELARQIGMDPIAFRLHNAATEGDRQPTGVPYPRIGCVEVLEAMRNHPHYSAPLEGPNRGRGIALAHRQNGGLRSSVTLSINADGTVNCVTGSVDIGGSRAAIAMQVAEALGIGAEDVHPTVVDTDSIGFTGPTAGSRTTYDTGLAVYNAAQEVTRQMAARAALLWDVEPDSVHCAKGVFVAERPHNPADRTSTDEELAAADTVTAGGDDKPEQLSMSFRDLAARLMRTGEPVICSATNDNADVGPIFGGLIVDVAVDADTGKVQIERCTAVMDAGQAIHPSYVEGQLQGGTVQGIGWALNEEYYVAEDGAMLNATLLDYRMPTSLDVPMIDTVLVEVPNPRHPYGVRGVAEVPIIPPLAAVANAIHDAVGVRLTALPMKPGVVHQALQEQARSR